MTTIIPVARPRRPSSSDDDNDNNISPPPADAESHYSGAGSTIPLDVESWLYSLDATYDGGCYEYDDNDVEAGAAVAPAKSPTPEGKDDDTVGIDAPRRVVGRSRRRYRDGGDDDNAGAATVVERHEGADVAREEDKDDKDANGGLRTVGDWTAYREDETGDGGDVYYRNVVTGESTWNPPPGFEDLAVDEKPSAASAVAAPARGAQTKKNTKKKVQGRAGPSGRRGGGVGGPAGGVSDRGAGDFDRRDDVVGDDDSIVSMAGHNQDGGAQSRPRLDRSNSSSSFSVSIYSTLCNPTPRMARYLCASSILLAVCSLGLAATGLGLMFFTNPDDGDDNISNLGGGSGISSAVIIEGGRPADDATLEQHEVAVDLETEDDGVGPKARLTNVPTLSATDVPTSSATDVPTYSPTMAPVELTPTASPSMRPIVLEVPATLLSTTLYAIADTWLEYNDTTAYGDKKRLMVDGWEPRAALLKFNLSSIVEYVRNTDDIVGYMLRLFSITDSPFGGKIDLLDMDCNDWDEYAISWMNAPECVFRNDSEYLVGRFEEEIPADEWNEAVIFLDYNESALPGLITLRVSSHYPNGIMYASRENVTLVPELVVYYTDPGPTGSPTIAVPSEGPTNAPSSSPVVSTPTLSPLKSPTGNPTKFPTYFPTTFAPTENGTKFPSSSPSATPPSIILPVTMDAMLRGGEYSNSRYGRDPFLTLHDERKVILEFDLSAANPNFVYEYTLQFFVTFVAENEVRSVTVSHVTQQDYVWSDSDVTWDTFGSPSAEEIGWFSIFRDDTETLVNIPLGMLTNSTVSANRLILVLESRAEESGRDKFDFRSKEFGEEFPGMIDTPPTLTGVPVLA